MKLPVDETLSLELLNDTHAEAIFELVDVNREVLREWLPWVDYMQTVEHFRKFVRDSEHSRKQEIDYGFVILEEESVVGRIGIYRVDQPNKTGSIGYWLGNGFAGRGIITKACEAIIDYGFETLQLNRLEIRCGTQNGKSKAVAERLGFKQEGILSQAEWIGDKCIDHYLFALLKEDWKPQITPGRS